MKLETKKARVHKKKKFFNHNNTDNMVLFLLQLPVLIYTLIFAYIPMYGIIIAFKKFNPRKGIWGSQWVGLENFEFFRRSKEFWEIFGRTVAYNVWFLFIGLVSAVGLAILFYSLSSKRLVKVYSTISILPRFMSAVLLSYLVYAFLNPVSGILNKIIEALGGTSIDWYMKPEPWPIIITFVKVWSSVGMSCLIYYATLVGIDASLFEAARLDGATRWQEMRYIEIPELSSVICINLIMGINGIVQGGDFDMFYTLTKDSAALYPTTNIIGTYMYRALMVNNDIGTTSALGVAQSVVGLILLLITNGVIRKISYDNRLF